MKKVLIITVFLILKVSAQTGTSYVAGQMLIKVNTPFTSIQVQDGVVNTGKQWFNTLAWQFEISELKPVFNKQSGELAKFYRVSFKKQFHVDQVIQAFKLNPKIELAWKNAYGRFLEDPDDQYYSNQWGLPKIKADQAWDIHSGSSSVIIGVIDSGIDLGDPDQPVDVHPDLLDNLWIDESTGFYGHNIPYPTTQPFDERGHGTHTSGIFGSVTNNTTGVAGVAGGGFSGDDGIKIMMVKAAIGAGKPTEEFTAPAIVWAADNGAQIITMSFVLDSPNEDPCDPPEIPNVEPFPALLTAVQYAYNNNVVLIGAIGNDSIDYSADDCYTQFKSPRPAFYPEVLAVAGTDTNDIRYHRSNFADWCDVSAPGTNIFSTYPRHKSQQFGYNYLTGTSMSAPFVAGLAGLILSYAPNADRDMIKNIIKSTTDNIDNLNPLYTGKLGTGRINANNALSLIESPPSKPTGVALQNINGHPYVSWASNSEPDMTQYKVKITYEHRNGPNPRFWTYTYETHYTTNVFYHDYGFFIGTGNDVAYYKISAIDVINNVSQPSSSVSTVGGVGKMLANDIPNNFSIYSNFPNPFNPNTTILFDLPERSKVTIIIYDVLGRTVKTLIQRTIEPGFHEILWNGKDNNGNPVSTGMYIYQFSAFSEESETQFVKNQKMVLIK